MLHLNRKIGSKELLETEALDWQKMRNDKAIKVNWSFTTEKERVKLINRYKENYNLNRQNNSINQPTTYNYKFSLTI